MISKHLIDRLKLSRTASLLSILGLLVSCTGYYDASTRRPSTPEAASTSPAAAPTVASAPAPQTPPAPAATPAPAPPPPIVPFDQAVLNAANALLGNADLPGSPSTLPLVIDPLIDGVTGAQTRATQLIGNRLAGLIREKYPRFEVRKFSSANVAKSPLVLIGTFTGVNNQRQTAGKREAYRICLALADLKTGKLVSKGLAFAQMDGVDSTPLAYFQDAPAWTEDPATLGYVRTCQGTRAGDPINAAYVDRILVASMISDAIDAYDLGRYADALALFQDAARTSGGRQLRVLNGIYQASWKLGRGTQAAEAFGDIVDFGLESKRLATMILFRPGSTSFIADTRVSGAYPMWLKEIAARAATGPACLEIVGNTSATGPEPLNERLSQLRAEYVKSELERQNPALRQRTIAYGVGSRATLVGNGRDDATDAIDRRVVFIVTAC